VRKVVRFLQRELGRRLVQTVSASSDYHLLTDGRHIFLEDSARQVVNVLKNSRQPMLAICLSDTMRRIRAEIRHKQLGAAKAPKAEKLQKPKPGPGSVPNAGHVRPEKPKLSAAAAKQRTLRREAS
jgi:hypothetical protein